MSRRRRRPAADVVVGVRGGSGDESGDESGDDGDCSDDSDGSDDGGGGNADRPRVEALLEKVGRHIEVTAFACVRPHHHFDLDYQGGRGQAEAEEEDLNRDQDEDGVQVVKNAPAPSKLLAPRSKAAGTAPARHKQRAPCNDGRSSGGDVDLRPTVRMRRT